ncbi:hypothetical protein SY86_15720 [Erwinia tracheiphila]|uniref:Uncharacterized protein n=1 Tax=Erwinia tracheiphila TaxID=65700 RepID=A0A0M2KGV1_9GAMM|nr:hypothetical protein SY86_15720 [Erwinia tracheiphila]
MPDQQILAGRSPHRCNKQFLFRGRLKPGLFQTLPGFIIKAMQRIQTQLVIIRGIGRRVALCVKIVTESLATVSG